jgi:twitching motility protein PilT
MIKRMLSPQVEELARTALRQNATDLFLLPDEPPVMRIAGRIQRAEADIFPAEEIEAFVEATFGTNAMEKIGTTVGELHRSFSLPGEAHVVMCAARSGGDYTLSATLSRAWLNPAETGIPDAMLRAVSAPYGLVIFAGPANSGKYMTAYSALEHINTNTACHICTVEDPILATLTPRKALIQQREVGLDIPHVLAGIHAARKQDVDVLFVREITGLEELLACISTAETGHLVILVLHAVSTPEGVIQRLLDIFPGDMQEVSRRALAEVLLGVSTQQLFPRSDAQGTATAYGVLIPDQEMRQAIADGKAFSTRTTSLPEGCQTIEQDTRRLRQEGILSPD